MSTTSTILTPSVLATAKKLRDLIPWQRDNRGLIGRSTELFVMEVCVVTKLHPLLYGEPGNAKSMSVDALLLHMPELRKFKTQAYKASPPEQFLGPISIKGMEQDMFVRIIAGKLADCEIGVVDEVSRAPRAVLPALQGIMVEREFDSGHGVVKVPMQSMIGTANHILDDPELAAFFDRWAFKLIVKPPQSQQEFVDILTGALERREHGEPDIPPELIISRDELTEFQQAATRVRVSDEIKWKLAELWSNVTGKGIISSVRRYVDLTASIGTVALMDDRDEAVVDDIQIAQHSLWNVDTEAPSVYEEVIKFASQWVQDKSAYLSTFADVVDRLGQVQTLVAAGSSKTENVEINDKTDTIYQHSIELLDEYDKIVPLLKGHIDAASGQDTSELDSAVTQADAGKRWIYDRILGFNPS